MTTNANEGDACTVCPIKSIGDARREGPCRTDPVDPKIGGCAADAPLPGTLRGPVQGSPSGAFTRDVAGPGLGGGIGGTWRDEPIAVSGGSGFRRGGVVMPNAQGQGTIALPAPPPPARVVAAAPPEPETPLRFDVRKPPAAQTPAVVIPKVQRPRPAKSSVDVLDPMRPVDLGRPSTSDKPAPAVTLVSSKMPTLTPAPFRSARPICDRPEYAGHELCLTPGNDSLSDECFGYGLSRFGGMIESPTALADELCGPAFRAARDARLAAAAAQPSASAKAGGAAAQDAANKPAGDPSIGPDLVRQCAEAFLRLSPAQRVAVMRAPGIGENAIARLYIGDALAGVDDPMNFLTWFNESFGYADPAVASFCRAVIAQSGGVMPAGAVLQPGGAYNVTGPAGDVDPRVGVFAPTGASFVIYEMPRGGTVYLNGAPRMGRWLDAAQTRWEVPSPPPANYLAGRQDVVVSAPNGEWRRVNAGQGPGRGVPLDVLNGATYAWSQLTPFDGTGYGTVWAQPTNPARLAPPSKQWEQGSVNGGPLNTKQGPGVQSSQVQRQRVVVLGMPHEGHVYFDPRGTRVPDAEGVIDYTLSGPGWLDAPNYRQWATSIPNFNGAGDWGVLYVAAPDGEVRQKVVSVDGAPGSTVTIDWKGMTASPAQWTQPPVKGRAPHPMQGQPFAAVLARVATPERLSVGKAFDSPVALMASWQGGPVAPAGDPGARAEVVIEGMPHDGRVLWGWSEVTHGGRGWLDAPAYRHWAVLATATPGQPQQLVVQDAAGRARAVSLDLRGPTLVSWDRMVPVPTPTFAPQGAPAAGFRPSGDVGGPGTMALIEALPMDELVHVMQGPAFAGEPYPAILARALLNGAFEQEGFPIVDLFTAYCRNVVAAGSAQQAILDADVGARARRLGLLTAASGEVTSRCGPPASYASAGIPAGFTAESWVALLSSNPAVAAQLQASDDARAAAEAQRPSTAQVVQGTITSAITGATTVVNNQNTAALANRQADYANQQAMARIQLERDQAAATRELSRLQAEQATNPNAVAIANANAQVAQANAALAESQRQATLAVTPPPVVAPTGWDALPGVAQAAVIGVPLAGAATGLFFLLRPSGHRAKGNGKQAAKRRGKGAKRNCHQMAGAAG